jgi:preprotein translocase subunit SecD
MRIWAAIIILAGLGLGYFVYSSQQPGTYLGDKFPFRLGLDLSGGTHLVYKAHTETIKPEEVNDSMSALRDVIERRVNLFGVSEPVVQTESRGYGATHEDRLIVELPGVTDVNKAVEMIGQTPVLEFKTEAPKEQVDALKKLKDEGKLPATFDTDHLYVDTPLTGRFLKKATIQFSSNSFQPSVSLEFNDEGGKIFAQLTKDNIGKTIAIYLDGAPISVPVVREEIKDGKAQITGNFTPQEAKLLAGRLNSGALPVAIELISTESIGASLGESVMYKDTMAGIYGFLILALFLILWYRFPGFVAVISLSIYIVIMLSIFKFIPVVLTSAGIAGLILSVGMAVDANILIFERSKEELRKGLTVDAALREGFHRAWPSIRDSNVSSMITACVLFWMGTSLVKGFALTFGLGVVVSMFTAITVTRTFLFSFKVKDTPAMKFLFSCGFGK